MSFGSVNEQNSFVFLEIDIFPESRSLTQTVPRAGTGGQTDDSQTQLTKTWKKSCSRAEFSAQEDDSNANV